MIGFLVLVGKNCDWWHNEGGLKKTRLTWMHVSTIRVQYSNAVKYKPLCTFGYFAMERYKGMIGLLIYSVLSVNTSKYEILATKIILWLLRAFTEPEDKESNCVKWLWRIFSPPRTLYVIPTRGVQANNIDESRWVNGQCGSIEVPGGNNSWHGGISYLPRTTVEWTIKSFRKAYTT